MILKMKKKKKTPDCLFHVQWFLMTLFSNFPPCAYPRMQHWPAQHSLSNTILPG